MTSWTGTGFEALDSDTDAGLPETLILGSCCSIALCCSESSIPPQTRDHRKHSQLLQQCVVLFRQMYSFVSLTPQTNRITIGTAQPNAATTAKGE